MHGIHTRMACASLLPFDICFVTRRGFFSAPVPFAIPPFLGYMIVSPQSNRGAQVIHMQVRCWHWPCVAVVSPCVPLSQPGFP